MTAHLAGLTLAALTICAGAAPASAQLVSYIDAITRKVTPVDAAHPLPTIGKQESFQLVSANTPSAAATGAGGDYILSQTCTGYGTLALQALGPDGVTWQTLLTKTSSDTAGGTGMSLGSYAQVRITVSGTTGCNTILARVPA